MVSLCICRKLFPVKKFELHFKLPLLFLPDNQLQLFSSKVSTNQRYFSSRLYADNAAISAALLDSTLCQNSSNQDSYTVSYLVNSCGLSPESALSTSEKVQFKTLAKPESVLTLLRKYGFSKTQIAKLVQKRPLLLLSDSQKSLLPKLQFLQSIGVSNAEIARTLSRDPTFLTRSLENQIIPSYNFLKSVLLSNEKIVASLRRTSWIFLEDHTKHLVPNVAILRDFGVRESCVVLLLTHFPEALMRKPEEFTSIVIEVSELGFDPLKSVFVLAIHVLSGEGNKSIRDRCSEVYKKWGWSNDEIRLAFRKHPNCMILSENKISRAMDFLVNKMGWQSSAIARCPTVLLFSLEKRIIPRCSVIQVLQLKGLIKKDVSLSTLLLPVEEYFLKKFVTKYEEEVPELLGVYEGKLDISEL